MKKLFKWIGIILLVLFVLALVLPFLFKDKIVAKIKEEANKNLNAKQLEIVERLLFRIRSVRKAKHNKYILLNAPNEKIKDIMALLPGMKSPSVLPLAESGWSSVHSVLNEDEFWEKIEQLKAAGAQGILVIPIEKMVI